MQANILKNFYTKLTILLSILTLVFFTGNKAYSSENSTNATSWQSSLENEGSQRLVIGKYDSENSKISAGLHVKLKDKWKTYWKQPGDSGMSHQIDFIKSENISDVKIIWPAPERSLFYDLEAWAYHGELVLPLDIRVIDPTKPAKLDITVKWAICDEICIFEEDDFKIDVEPGFVAEENQALIHKYIEASSNGANPDNLTITKTEHLSGNVLKVYISSNNTLSDNIDNFIVEDSKSFRFPKPVVEFSDDKKSAVITTKYEQQISTKPLAGNKVEITIINNGKAVSAEQVISEASGAPQTVIPAQKADVSEALPVQNSTAKISILTAIFAAIIGGLILNIMPCVLPVLSIKILSVIKLGGADKKTIRKSFLFTILGIISSFLTLAAFVISLKLSGDLVGWGTQFQHPLFVIFLIFVLIIFSANLFGFFEINLHSKFSDKINEKLDHKPSSNLNNFLTGVFATLLATPCTAPFLVTAVSFALSQGVLEILYIFFFMGVGLAVPYILVLISPSLIKIFPKPGNWMVKFKKLMGLFLIITAIWLVYVIAGITNLFAATSTFVAVVIYFWLLWYFNRKGLSRTRIVLCTIYVFAVAVTGPVYFFQPMTKKVEANEYWEAFSPEKLQQRIANNDIILVDVTADWCLSCQFNKKRVIYPMLNYLRENKVVGIKADFTSPSKEISQFLQSYNEYGIPFNVVYGPKAKQGIKLPPLLTEDDVKAAIEKAKGD